MDNLSRIDDYKNDDEFKIELIDGKITMMSPRPRITHARVSGRVFREFSVYLKGKKCEAFGDGVDVYLDEKNRFIPDVTIVCNPDIVQEDGIHGAPDLVVEVLSPATAKNDRTKKKDAYGRAGVKEYWLVDTFGKSVEIYLNSGDSDLKLEQIYYYYNETAKEENDKFAEDNRDIIHDKIKVSICDNLIVYLKDIFE